MNAYWQFNKFIKLNKEHLIKSTNSFKQNKRRTIRGTTISIILISTALIIPVIIQVFNFILLFNFISIYLLVRNIRRNKRFSEGQKEFLLNYEKAIERWDKMPQTHSELSYEEILDLCKKQFHDLINTMIKPTEQEEKT